MKRRRSHSVTAVVIASVSALTNTKSDNACQYGCTVPYGDKGRSNGAVRDSFPQTIMVFNGQIELLAPLSPGTSNNHTGGRAVTAAGIVSEVADPEVPTTAAPNNVEHVLGEIDALVTVIEFGDYECPYCAGAAPVLRELVSSSGGRVRLVFRNFPLFEVHPHALTAALAAESTADTGGEKVFWVMHQKLFVHQARLSDVDLRLYAEAVGADPRLAVGEPAQKYAPIVQADYAMGMAAGVSGTPALFIDGVAYEGRVDVPSLQHATGQSARGDSPARRRPWQRR
jgi:protein-disulfide isomerase